jgi:hypothetical protein
VTVLFKLVQAETEKDNVKSDTKRLFVPCLDAVAVGAGEEEEKDSPRRRGGHGEEPVKHRYLVIHGTTNPHGEGGERKVCVIWRDVTGWKAADFKADAEFVKREELAAGADEVFVNADSVIPGGRVLDGVFKERMFAPVNV